ncbi:Vps23 core domain-containing protein [Globomyces pollinis-pini]|nr:Vps23 core domain-containing protein [Globomyces pollinis-pini]
MKNKLELRKKLKQQVETFKSQSPIEINRLYSVQQQLVGHSSHIEQTIKQLKYVHNVLEQNATILQEKNMEIQKNIDLLKSKPNPDIDELLTPKHLLHQQLLECSCDVHTIDDVIYYLTKGFGSSSKDTTAFIKNIRTLSKEAFMKKALMEKIEGILINIP